MLGVSTHLDLVLIRESSKVKVMTSEAAVVDERAPQVSGRIFESSADVKLQIRIARAPVCSASAVSSSQVAITLRRINHVTKPSLLHMWLTALASRSAAFDSHFRLFDRNISRATSA